MVFQWHSLLALLETVLVLEIIQCFVLCAIFLNALLNTPCL